MDKSQKKKMRHKKYQPQKANVKFQKRQKYNHRKQISDYQGPGSGVIILIEKEHEGNWGGGRALDRNILQGIWPILYTNHKWSIIFKIMNHYVVHLKLI